MGKREIRFSKKQGRVKKQDTNTAGGNDQDNGEVKQAPGKFGEVYLLETPLELINLLNHVNGQCALKGHWLYMIFMLLCSIDDEQYYIGTQYDLVYFSRADLGKNLRIRYLREFFARYYGSKFQIVVPEIWAFEYARRGPFPERYRAVNDPGVLAQVDASIREFLETLRPKQEVLRQRKEQAGEDTPAWETCSICSDIQEKCYSFCVHGDLQNGKIPGNEIYLTVLGAPFFNDSQTYRHWCIKQCPECHTCYLWEFDYEYLMGGSGDEVTLTRLSTSEAGKWISKVNLTIQTSRENLEANALPHLEVLKTSTNQKALKNSIHYFFHEQLVHGHDIRFVIPSLVYFLAHHQHVRKRKRSCPAYWASSIVIDFAWKSTVNRDYLIDKMEEIRDEVTSSGLEFQEVWDRVTSEDFGCKE
ncbi:MAG: hypothetical protein JXB88_20100 [Spirochaetales bacterium]|nr:hypothetical protein [Spirochaetales bacterium]